MDKIGRFKNNLRLLRDMVLIEDKEVYLLEDIIENERFILTDNGVCEDNTHWFSEDMYVCKYYSQLNKLTLMTKYDQYEDFKNLLSLDNIYTVSRVPEEIKRFRDKMRNNIKYLNTKEKNKLKTYKRFNDEEKLNAEEKKEIFEQLCWLYSQIYKLAKRKVLKIDDQDRFDVFMNLVTYISEVTDAKRSYQNRYNKIESKSKDLHTDEQIVASLIKKSVDEHESWAVITCDSDIQRLLSGTIYYMTLDTIKGNDNLINAIYQYPIRCYFLNKEEQTFIKTFDSSKSEVNFICKHKRLYPVGEIIYQVVKILENGNLINSDTSPMNNEKEIDL